MQLGKSGAKCWRMNYRFAGKDKTLALGIYPNVSLSCALCRQRSASSNSSSSQALDVTAVLLSRFLVATDEGGAIAGSVCLEPLRMDALLRSLAVDLHL
ncbi:Arm DNA-binding domain-containing protein [Paraburkholderia sp. Tr-20389]|uniref:Arm DNA-binding domain-containing protein n=1 Tax=Paraburkholderia sp. Tr-20389 TaxID=2703903 RepID=UPI00321673AB